MRRLARETAVFLYGPLYSFLTLPALFIRQRIRREKLGKTSAAQLSFDGIGQGLDACDVVYINLEKRKDRRLDIETELRRMGITNAVRQVGFEAVPGILGANLSHAEALMKCGSGKELVMICEDDAQFELDRESTDHMIEQFRRDSSLDVLCLSYSIKGAAVRISSQFQISNGIQTAACYVVRRDRTIPLIRCFQSGAEELSQGGRNWIHALDIAWKSLQRWSLVFAVPNELAVSQRPSWSDIEKKRVAYFAPDS